MDRSAVVRFGRARRHPEQIGSTARLNCRPVRAREAARRNTGPGIRDRPGVRSVRARRHVVSQRTRPLAAAGVRSVRARRHRVQAGSHVYTGRQGAGTPPLS